MALRQKSSKQQLEFEDGRNEDDNMPHLADDVALESDDEDSKKKLKKVPRAKEKPGRSLGRPVCRIGKKKKQPIAPVMGYYKTVAMLFEPGYFPMPRVPQMLIEVKEEDAELRMGKIQVIGEVWCGGIMINGEGGLKKRGRHLHTTSDSKLNIDTEEMECLYSGFISATLKPTVSGSCFSVCHVDPRLEEEEGEAEEGEEEGGEEEEEYQPPMRDMRVKEGDILCKFTVASVNRKQKKPDARTHLMRLLPLSSITKLNDEGILDEVFKAGSGGVSPADNLSQVVQCIGVVVDGL
jgi:hypothetical protein